ADESLRIWRRYRALTPNHRPKSRPPRTAGQEPPPSEGTARQPTARSDDDAEAPSRDALRPLGTAQIPTGTATKSEHGHPAEPTPEQPPKRRRVRRSRSEKSASPLGTADLLPVRRMHLPHCRSYRHTGRGFLDQGAQPSGSC